MSRSNRDASPGSLDPAVELRRRWWAVVILCVGQLMIVLNSTVVNVALPTIQKDLHFSQASLSWVIDAYLMTFGGFLMLSGRLGDLLGRKRVFQAGIVAFVVTSLVCGLARSQSFLVGARFAQGVAAAAVSAMVLGMIATLFSDARNHARAMGIYALITSSGAALGLVIGGVVTQSVGWHWIFFINVPIGALTLLAGAWVLDDDTGIGLSRGVDVLGAVLITAAAGSVVYGFIHASTAGWATIGTAGPLLAAAVLIAVFVALESRVRQPLIPFSIFHRNNVGPANLVRLFAGVGMFGVNFLGVLYVQRVLLYSPERTGLAFLPYTAGIALVALYITPRVVARIGPRPTLMIALLMLAGGHLLFSRAPVEGTYLLDVMPPLIVLGVANGLLFLPSITFAMGDVARSDSGLASGLANTSLQMGSALGVALLASVATARTDTLSAHGAAPAGALTAGYHVAFAVAAGSVGVALLASSLLRPSPLTRLFRRTTTPQPETTS